MGTLPTVSSCQPHLDGHRTVLPPTPQWPKGLLILPGHCKCHPCPPHPGHSCAELLCPDAPCPHGNIPEHTPSPRHRGPALSAAASLPPTPCLMLMGQHCRRLCPLSHSGDVLRHSTQGAKRTCRTWPKVLCSSQELTAPGLSPCSAPSASSAGTSPADPWGPHGGGESGQTHRNEGQRTR